MYALKPLSTYLWRESLFKTLVKEHKHKCHNTSDGLNTLN